MLQAWIMVCLISNPQVCFEASDNRGLHATKQQCMTRVEEMIRDISTIPDHRPVAYKCTRVQGKQPI